MRHMIRKRRHNHNNNDDDDNISHIISSIESKIKKRTSGDD